MWDSNYPHNTNHTSIFWFQGMHGPFKKPSSKETIDNEKWNPEINYLTITHLHCTCTGQVLAKRPVTIKTWEEFFSALILLAELMWLSGPRRNLLALPWAWSRNINSPTQNPYRVGLKCWREPLCSACRKMNNPYITLWTHAMPRSLRDIIRPWSTSHGASEDI